MITIVITAGVALIVGALIGGYVVYEHQQDAIAEWESNNSKQQ